MEVTAATSTCSAWAHACNFWCHRQSKISKNSRRLLSHQTVLTSKPLTATTGLLVSSQPTTRLQMLEEAVNGVENAMAKGVRLGPDIFSSLLETCFQMGAFDYGWRIRKLIPQHVLRRTPSLSAKLLRLYAVCGYVEDAHQIFDEMPQPASVFAWNSLISGYVEKGCFEDALALYYQMDEMRVEPDNFTFPRVLKACTGIGSLQRGEDVHRRIVRYGYSHDLFVVNALIDMYAKCGELLKARKLFDEMPVRDIVSWNTMLIGYNRHGCLGYAADMLRLMVAEGFEPDSVAISTMLSGCASAPNFRGIKMGTQIHARIFRQGNELDLSISNSLIDMYSKLNLITRTRIVFDQIVEKDTVSWNSIIYAYCTKDPMEAFNMFESMIDSGATPDKITFVALLSACINQSASSPSPVDVGRDLFNLMQEKYGIEPCMEHYACMVNLLGRSGLVDEAYDLIIEQMQPPLEPGASIWGALLFACSVHGNVDVGEVAADRLFELEPDNMENFNLLLQLYCGAERWEDADRVRVMIEERGL